MVCIIRTVYTIRTVCTICMVFTIYTVCALFIYRVAFCCNLFIGVAFCRNLLLGAAILLQNVRFTQIAIDHIHLPQTATTSPKKFFLIYGKGVAQAYIIGLSINKNLKLKRGKGKNSSAVRYFMWSSSYVSLRNHVYHNLPFSTSAVTVSS